jgi:hypothetical protein
LNDYHPQAQNKSHPTLEEFFLKFSPHDPQNNSTIPFAALSTFDPLLRVPTKPDQQCFGHAVVTFSEVIQMSSLQLPQLPVSINVMMQCVRRAGVNTTIQQPNKLRVNLKEIAKAMVWVVDIKAEMRDEWVSIDDAITRLAGPPQVCSRV